jgi:hypothetical protein
MMDLVNAQCEFFQGCGAQQRYAVLIAEDTQNTLGLLPDA